MGFYTHAHEIIMGSLDRTLALTLAISWDLSELWFLLNERQQC